MKKLFTLISVILLTLSSFGQTRITKAAVNFRMTPAMDGKIICRIPKGTAISLITGIISCRHWVPIQYNGKADFVYDTYLKKNPAQVSEDMLVDSLSPPLPSDFIVW